MELFRQKSKPVSVVMTLLILFFAVPYPPVSAAMIGTETVIETARAQKARDCLNRMMTREDLQTVLSLYGISPIEAKARLATLSDTEIMCFFDQIEQLPAGGSDLGVAFIAVGVICILLFITDLLGYTDVFSFTR
ncbi:MAG: PA2779 family protein [Deltaproteobacteria bacterium]|nr:PA2779 family protein [Deltaproteobacteria bacterium]MBW1958653.1 PA2779 family protein [Deltaproteobacteria bacterium]MBW2089778.1 PA2779 family protein [Deltaproteobacteria bacterium]MBW2320532.1 PA2779 family protein [Deltaproteobacteria bacterium]